jgi:hypothetical protein
MSHTTQRRGISEAYRGKELIVLAMIPSQYKNLPGIREAMRELAMKMLDYGPQNWMSRNFTEITYPRLGASQDFINWVHEILPESTTRYVMSKIGSQSSVVTAVYTDSTKVVALLNDLKRDWLVRNREKGYPISIVMSALVSDIHDCCRKTDLKEHTYLHSLGFFGNVQELPSADELSLVTMCGHGLIAVNRVRYLLKSIRSGRMTAEDAAGNLARPCTCGIVNRERAKEIFQRLGSGIMG